MQRDGTPRRGQNGGQDGSQSTALSRVGRSVHPVALVRGLWSRPKLYIAIAVAAVTLWLAPDSLPKSARAVMAWDAGAIVYVALALWIFASHDSDDIRKLAAAEDETRFTFFVIVIVAALLSFWSVVGLIGEARAVEGMVKGGFLALSGVAILSSWLVLQIVFTLHYAHDYYRGGADDDGSANEKGKGIEFPGGGEPDYWDFFYFTTSIGAASQTSDVTISSRAVRRLVTLQAILSFVFNTAVVALAINLAASLL